MFEKGFPKSTYRLPYYHKLEKFLNCQSKSIQSTHFEVIGYNRAYVKVGYFLKKQVYTNKWS